MAAKGGHLKILQWARAQDPPCPWDEKTCEVAAERGHLEILKFLRGQDPPCPWSRDECREEASRSGHQHIIDWMSEIPLEQDRS